MVDEVWTRCVDCQEPIKLLDSAWHHEEAADHPADPDYGRPLVVVKEESHVAGAV